MTKILIPTLMIAVVAGLAVLIDDQSSDPVMRPAAPAGPYRIYAPGRVEGTTPEIELRPQLAGPVVEILITEGQTVAEGDVLLRLDDATYGRNVALAEAQLELAEAELQRLVNGAHPQEKLEAAAAYRARLARVHQAQVKWERIERLQAAQAIAQQEADDVRKRLESLVAESEAAKARLERLEAPARQDELRMAEARVQAARARLELAQDQLEKTRLHAPAAGQILNLNRERGEWTGPTSPDPAIVMVDTSRLHVRAFIEEQDAPKVRIGMPAEIEVDGLPGQTVAGRVVKLSPRMDPKQVWTNRPAERFDTKVREAWIELEQTKTAKSLVVGLRVDVVIDPATTPAEPRNGNKRQKKATGGREPTDDSPLARAG